MSLSTISTLYVHFWYPNNITLLKLAMQALKIYHKETKKREKSNSCGSTLQHQQFSSLTCNSDPEACLCPKPHHYTLLSLVWRSWICQLTFVIQQQVTSSFLHTLWLVQHNVHPLVTCINFVSISNFNSPAILNQSQFESVNVQVIKIIKFLSDSMSIEEKIEPHTLTKL